VLKNLDGILPDLGFIKDLQAILARIQSVSDLLTQVVDVARHTAQKVALLTDPAAQLKTWLDEIFNKLQDATALQTPLSALGDAVTAARASALTATWQTATSAVRAKLIAAQARTLHTQIVSRRNTLASAVNGLKDKADQAALQTWLAAFNPGAPAFAAAFLSVNQLEQALTRADAGVSAVLEPWDARYLQPGGVLQSIVQTGASVDDVRSWVREAVDRQLGAPVVGFLQQLRDIGSLLTAFTDGLDALSQAVVAKITTVLAAPQALLDTYTAMQTLLKRLSELDLSALQADVEALYQTLLDQARTLDPRTLEKALTDKFDTLLGTLSLSTVINPALRASINSTYQNVIKKVDALDPQLLLVQPMQDLYEKDILPLLDVFDISDTVKHLVDFLSGLDEQLSTQMDRVDTAYQAMLAAAPGGNGGSASVGASL
jgi:hypothetical protein